MTKALVRPDTVINGTSMAFGEADLITDTTLHEGDYRAIQFLEDTVFETLTCTDTTLNGAGNPVASDWGTFSKGDAPLLRNFTGIKLTSGKVLAHKQYL